MKNTKLWIKIVALALAAFMAAGTIYSVIALIVAM